MHKTTIWIILLTGFTLSCQQENKTEPAKSYFDLAGYFKKEAIRLQHHNKAIIKTVGVGKNTEKKQINIRDWSQEMKIFSGSDINKPAWQGAFEVIDKGNELIYHTSNPKIDVKKIVIQKQGNAVKSILIYTKAKNTLYTTSDTLFYAVDSIYEIRSWQKIQLLPAKSYIISGRFQP